MAKKTKKNSAKNSTYPNVLTATDEDLDKAFKKALKRAGVSYDELKAQSLTGYYDNIGCRLAWMAISGIEKSRGYTGEKKIS